MYNIAYLPIRGAGEAGFKCGAAAALPDLQGARGGVPHVRGAHRGSRPERRGAAAAPTQGPALALDGATGCPKPAATHHRPAAPGFFSWVTLSLLKQTKSTCSGCCQWPMY